METARELFLRIMNFKSAKRTLKWELGYWGGTIKRWYSEGLPKNMGLVTEISDGDSVVGPGVANASPSTTGDFPLYDFDVSSYFSFDESFYHFPYNYWIYPRFEKKVIREDEKFIELIDTDGVTKRKLKDNTSMPMWLDFPVKSKLDWEKIKEERFNLNSINKRFHIDPDNLIKETKNCNMPVGVLDAPIGFFGTLRYLMGELNLFLMYHDEPLLIKDMCEHFCNLWIAVSEELTSKIDFDLACFWEDMSGKQGSLISPNTFKEFMQPYYNRLINFLKSRGVKLFLVDTDGDVSGLIPLFIESGINIMYPFEQQAGNDLIKIRKDYPRFGILGGFDKNTLFKGKDNIDKELEKMSYLISKGGYIPFCDHLVPPNCSWDSFKYYRNNLNNIIDSTGIL